MAVDELCERQYLFDLESHKSEAEHTNIDPTGATNTVDSHKEGGRVWSKNSNAEIASGLQVEGQAHSCLTHALVRPLHTLPLPIDMNNGGSLGRSVMMHRKQYQGELTYIRADCSSAW